MNYDVKSTKTDRLSKENISQKNWPDAYVSYGVVAGPKCRQDSEIFIECMCKKEQKTKKQQKYYGGNKEHTNHTNGGN